MTVDAQPTSHDAILGTGNGLVSFVCCSRTETPFDALWTAPDGRGTANVFHTPRQAYELVARHLTRGHDEATLGPLLEAADHLVTQAPASEPWPTSRDDVRPAIEYLADHLDNVHVTVRDD